MTGASAGLRFNWSLVPDESPLGRVQIAPQPSSTFGTHHWLQHAADMGHELHASGSMTTTTRCQSTDDN